jgi:hypothetical protein
MRPFLLRELQARAHAIPNPDESQSMDFWVEKFGATAAAWLVWSQRRKFRRMGVVDFTIPKTIPTPPWFRVAVETMKRNAHWTVSTTHGPATRTYRVCWERWHNQWKPAVIAHAR